VPLHDLRVSVTEEEAATGAVPVAPLLDIAPPRRGVAVDGRYPTDPDYPLVEEVYVTVATEDATLRAWQAGIPSAAPAKPIVWISAVGDMMLSRGIDRALLSGDAGIQRTFADTLPILQEADLLLGNLEGAVTRRGTPAEKSYTFRFPPEVLSPLGRVGFDYVSLTNNHAYDYGEPGFLDTLDNLSRSEIATSGAGRSLEEARRSWDTTVRGQPVHVLSLGAYPRERNGFDGLRQASARDDRAGILWATDQLIADLPELLSGAGFTIVMVHGGQEWAERPTEGQRRLYRQLANAGADLVVGSHPHVVQGLEGYRGSLIAYSLGNFLFNGMQQTRYGEESVILTVGAHEGAIRYVEPKPVQISGPRVSLDKSGSILERLSARTQELNQ
jgi:poly-gamma-glutamate synthesis protein (capsule biosynthesis protein)